MRLYTSDLAPGLVVGDAVKLGEGVELGANIVIHGGTEVGDGCELGDGVVLGKAPKLSKLSTAPENISDPLQMESGAVICAGAVVFATARIGSDTIIGDQAQIRERAEIGQGTVIGRGTAVDNDVKIGDRVRVQSNCYLTAYSVIENDVFVGPGVVMTNDHTMGRHSPDISLNGPTLRKACRIGGGAILAPGIEVGEEAFVAMGAVVTGDVPPRSVVMGVPAKHVRDVPERDLLNRLR